MNKKSILSFAVLCITTGISVVPAMADSGISGQSTNVVLNSQEQSIMGTMSSQDQELIINMLQSRNNGSIDTFKSQYAGELSSFQQRHKNILAKLASVSDASQFLEHMGTLQLKSNQSKTYQFPDGSGLIFGNKVTPLSPNAHPEVVIESSNSTANTNTSGSKINPPLSLNAHPQVVNESSNSVANRSSSGGKVNFGTIHPRFDSYLGNSDYQDDNYAVEFYGALTDSIDFYVDYTSIEFEDVNGNLLGYGANIYREIPDAQANGVGAICSSNGNEPITNNDSRYATITSEYTVGFNIEGVVHTNTWQLETYWDSSLSSLAPNYSNFTPLLPGATY